ncbi:acetylcholine receptor subunit alpha-1-A-like [Physella acuta]|uniref:acetylcholine receptor subunit alpha-1-A-like n=1 Tax=Physella acuta TaxID=109671 RepID=UPI0027DB6CF5|nr:acetylcholine receptor subunit alpha-1-A-like [Physella acuta]
MATDQLTFKFKRRPNFLLINIILPIVFLSFLNILVFVIPVESGEKIGYGITVLLSLSVFMSIMGSLLPRSSLTTPKVTIYILILMVLSMMTVIVSIIIVFLHHMEEKEENHQRAKEKFKSAFNKVAVYSKTVSQFRTPNNKVQAVSDNQSNPLRRLAEDALAAQKSENPGNMDSDGENPKLKLAEDAPKQNKFKIVGKYIDLVCFVVFLVIWLVVTLKFMFDIAKVIEI